MSDQVIEHSHITIKDGQADSYVAEFPRFREIFMSHPGAVSVRLLRNKGDANEFVCAMEWVSPEAKQHLIADPAVKEWMGVFWPMVAAETNQYFDAVG
jgi:quinol monooxygenase YgiN